ncbi:MAG: hypothetical protein ACREX3_05645 [Gammaproteobacteria bacterium]
MLSRQAHLFPVYGAQSLRRVWLCTDRPTPTRGDLSEQGPNHCTMRYRHAVKAGPKLRTA